LGSIASASALVERKKTTVRRGTENYWDRFPDSETHRARQRVVVVDHGLGLTNILSAGSALPSAIILTFAGQCDRISINRHARLCIPLEGLQVFVGPCTKIPSGTECRPSRNTTAHTSTTAKRSVSAASSAFIQSFRRA
jgi:hypothetical protein